MRYVNIVDFLSFYDVRQNKNWLSFFYGSVEWSHMPGSDSIEIKTEQVRIEMRINGPA